MIEKNEKSMTITKPLTIDDIMTLIKELKFTNIPICRGCEVCVKNVDMAFRCRVYEVLEKVYYDLGCEEVLKIINEHCPNLSVCPLCHVDDFVHSTSCPYMRLDE